MIVGESHGEVVDGVHAVRLHPRNVRFVYIRRYVEFPVPPNQFEPVDVTFQEAVERLELIRVDDRVVHASREVTPRVS